VVVVVFNEGDRPFDPSLLSSHYIHVYIVVTPIGPPELTKKQKLTPKSPDYVPAEQHYRISVCTKAGVSVFGPYLGTNVVALASIRSWLACKAINGERAARLEDAFRLSRERTSELALEGIFSTSLSTSINRKRLRHSLSNTSLPTLALRRNLSRQHSAPDIGQWIPKLNAESSSEESSPTNSG
jgi:hypothetical protein